MTEGRTEKKAAWKEDKTVSRKKGRKEVNDGREERRNKGRK